MGQQYFFLDTTALGAVAGRFDDTAELIECAAHTQLRRLAFDGAVAGRVYAVAGDALRRKLDRWGVELARWSRASAEIAAALRAGAQNYADAELRAADRVG